MPSRFDRAIDVTRDSLPLAAVPIAASLLSLSKVTRALEAGPGIGASFPFPMGLPTLWTYVSLPGGTGSDSVTGPLSLVLFVPLFLVGLLITSALEAGFLGSLSGRATDNPTAFGENVMSFTLRMVGVNLVQFVVVLIALPLVFFPPLAILVLLFVTYFVYGLPFEIVVHDTGVLTGLNATVSRATDGGSYAAFGIAHLVVGTVGSFFLTGLVRNGGLVGVLIGALVVAVPSVFVASYGILVFSEYDETRGPTPVVE